MAGNIAFYMAVAIAAALLYWIISDKWKERNRAHLLGRENIFRPEADVVSPERVKEMWFIPQRVRAERPIARSDAEKRAATMPLIAKTGVRKQAPVRGACALCDKQVTMPYKCKFCGGLYCDEHRLPESHNCKGLRKLRREQKRLA